MGEKIKGYEDITELRAALHWALSQFKLLSFTEPDGQGKRKLRCRYCAAVSQFNEGEGSIRHYSDRDAQMTTQGINAIFHLHYCVAYLATAYTEEAPYKQRWSGSDSAPIFD